MITLIPKLLYLRHKQKPSLCDGGDSCAVRPASWFLEQTACVKHLKGNMQSQIFVLFSLSDLPARVYTYLAQVTFVCLVDATETTPVSVHQPFSECMMEPPIPLFL